MIAQKKFVVDGDEYEITQLGALEGRKLWLRIVKTIAGAMKVLAEHDEFDEKAAAAGLASLVSELDEDTFELLCAAFAKRTLLRNGDKWPTLDGAAFDMHFAGRYLSMTKWLGECIAFNFADFLGDMSLGKLIAQAKAKMGASKSKSHPDSTGSPGAS